MLVLNKGLYLYFLLTIVYVFLRILTCKLVSNLPFLFLYKSNLAGPFPYTGQGMNNGFMFGLPFKRYFDGTSIHSPYEQDLLVAFKELTNTNYTHRLVAFDELSYVFI